jgi:hypothetical protein
VSRPVSRECALQTNYEDTNFLLLLRSFSCFLCVVQFCLLPLFSILLRWKYLKNLKLNLALSALSQLANISRALSCQKRRRKKDVAILTVLADGKRGVECNTMNEIKRCHLYYLLFHEHNSSISSFSQVKTCKAVMAKYGSTLTSILVEAFRHRRHLKISFLVYLNT